MDNTEFKRDQIEASNESDDENEKYMTTNVRRRADGFAVVAGEDSCLPKMLSRICTQ